ncbi:MAG: hypothetical protein P8X42_12140 [Calditrichaceae bacterium]
MKKLAEKPGLIEGIYNYCDQWCERCPFTDRCLNFALSEKHFTKSDKGLDDEIFWKELHEIFQLTLGMVKEAAEEMGVDLDDIDAEEVRIWQEKFDNLAENHSCAVMSKAYADNVTQWFDNAGNIFEFKAGELASNLQIGLPESEIERELERIHNMIEIIRWYQYQIHIKILRALRSKWEDDQTDDDIQNDSNGSAKVALIGIDRSIGAWGAMLSMFPEKEDSIYDILVPLEK